VKVIVKVKCVSSWLCLLRENNIFGEKKIGSDGRLNTNVE
jgi:hypothetical protein